MLVSFDVLAFNHLLLLISGDILLVFSLILKILLLVQIKNILAPGVADPKGLWSGCKMDINNCSPDQLSKMQG